MALSSSVPRALNDGKVEFERLAAYQSKQNFQKLPLYVAYKSLGTMDFSWYLFEAQTDFICCLRKIMLCNLVSCTS